MTAVISSFTSYIVVPDLTIYLHTSPTKLASRMYAKADQTRSDHDLLADPGLLQWLPGRYDQITATATSYRPHVGVHLILTAGGKVLLNTGFADGSWSLPGGCLDEGETLPAAAAREALEETASPSTPPTSPSPSRGSRARTGRSAHRSARVHEP